MKKLAPLILLAFVTLALTVLADPPDCEVTCYEDWCPLGPFCVWRCQGTGSIIVCDDETETTDICEAVRAWVAVNGLPGPVTSPLLSPLACPATRAYLPLVTLYAE